MNAEQLRLAAEAVSECKQVIHADNGIVAAKLSFGDPLQLATAMLLLTDPEELDCCGAGSFRHLGFQDVFTSNGVGRFEITSKDSSHTLGVDCYRERRVGIEKRGSRGAIYCPWVKTLGQLRALWFSVTGEILGGGE